MKTFWPLFYGIGNSDRIPYSIKNIIASFLLEMR